MPPRMLWMLGKPRPVSRAAAVVLRTPARHTQMMFLPLYCSSSWYLCYHRV
jgi:hypothetical protein